MKRRLGPTIYEEAQAMHQMDTLDAMYDNFKSENPTMFQPCAQTNCISCSKFKDLKPWNLKSSKQESCLCKSCENFGLYEQSLADIFKLLEDQLKDGATNVGEELDNDVDPIVLLLKYQKLHKLTQMKRRIEKVESWLCLQAFERGAMGCIDPAGCKNIDSEDYAPCAKPECGFKHLWSEGLRKETIDKDGNLMPDAHPIWLREVSWSRYKTATDTDGKKTLRSEVKGSIVEFFDDFERVCNKYTYHRYILHRTRQTNQQFDRDANPGMLKLDVDWAENFTMLHAREIQSEYWLLKQLSLFVGIGKLLSEEKWEATSGALDVGSEVTVTSTQHGMFWAEVVESGGGEEGAVCTVRDVAGSKHQLQRCELRERVWYTVAQTGVTNDKKHDSYSTQHFMDLFINEWLQEHNIVSIHIHSDNAGSHFKNSRTLNYLSRLRSRLQSVVEEAGVVFKVTWSFGCPGHGKGPWDGFGGLLKRVMRRDTIDGNVVILDYVEAAQHLRRKFCTAGWQQKHGLDSRYTINKVSIFDAHSKGINRKEHEVYESVVGIQKSFGYMALGGERVLQRWFDCWCCKCLLVASPGVPPMDSNYQVPACECGEPWWEHSVALLGARGIMAQKKQAQSRGRELARKLKPNSFIAVQDRQGQGHTVPFLIGITLDTGGGSCIIEEVQDRKTINGTRFDPGVVAAAPSAWVLISCCALR